MSVKEYMDMLQIENSKLSKENSLLKEKLMIATKMEIREIEKNTFVGIDYYVQENRQLKRENEALKQVHEHDINMIDEVKGESVKLYQRIEKAIEYYEIIDNRNTYIEISELRHLINLLKGDKE